MGDNVVALLTRLRDQKDTVDEILGHLSNLDTDAREFYLRALLTVAGLRGLEEMIEEEARKMPLLNDILENRVLGRRVQAWRTLPIAASDRRAVRPRTTVG